LNGFLTTAKPVSVAGLPDGLFSNQKSQFGSILEVPAMEDAGTFYDNLVYFTQILYIFWPFGIVYGHYVYFSPVWYVVLRKIWQPCSEAALNRLRTHKTSLKTSFGRPEKEFRALNLKNGNGSSFNCTFACWRSTI
jgi:hypothetical protein